MDKNKLALVVIVLIVALASLTQAQDRTLAGEINKKYTEELAPGTATMQYSSVATGTITSISDRYELRVYCLEPLVASTAWIAINSSVATTSQGVPVFRGNPLIIQLSDDVAVSWSASEALDLCIVQTSR